MCTLVGLFTKPDTSGSPSWPSRLLPHARTPPSLVSASEWCEPAVICTIFDPASPESYTNMGVLAESPIADTPRPSWPSWSQPQAKIFCDPEGLSVRPLRILQEDRMFNGFNGILQIFTVDCFRFPRLQRYYLDIDTWHVQWFQLI